MIQLNDMLTYGGAKTQKDRHKTHTGRLPEYLILHHGKCPVIFLGDMLESLISQKRDGPISAMNANAISNKCNHPKNLEILLKTIIMICFLS